MKLDLARWSWLLLGVSTLLLVTLTLFESSLAGMSTTTERWVTFLGLVTLPVIGAMLGVLSLIRREGRAWLAATALALNSLFALFHLMIVLFAG